MRKKIKEKIFSLRLKSLEEILVEGKIPQRLSGLIYNIWIHMFTPGDISETVHNVYGGFSECGSENEREIERDNKYKRKKGRKK